MDKIAAMRMLLKGHVGDKLKLVAESAKKGIKILEENGRLYAEYPKKISGTVNADDAYGFLNAKRRIPGSGFSKKGSKAEVILEKIALSKELLSRADAKASNLATAVLKDPNFMQSTYKEFAKRQKQSLLFGSGAFKKKINEIFSK